MKIVISGTTGVGKSTAVNKLKTYFENKGKKVIVLGELIIDSPYFDLYFSNLVEWGFLAQLDFLHERFEQYIRMETEYNNDENTVIIFDRHFLEDIIFAELKWVKENTPSSLTNAYKNIYNNLIIKINLFSKPDYFFLLKASFETVQQRMKERGRTQEEKFNIKYWQDLYYRYYSKKSYRAIFKENSKLFVELDTDDSNPDDVIKKIIKYMDNRTK